MKAIYFISGLPRSGSTMLANILRQNPDIHAQSVSSLASLLASVNANWMQYEQNQEYQDYQAKVGVLRSMIHGYYAHVDRDIVIDKDRGWTPQIGLIEALLDRPVKIISCVRNPAEILASFEKLRRKNPLFHTRVDENLREGSTIAARCMYYASPDGPLGRSHQNLKDAWISGYLDRFLYVDYNRYCNSPRSQTKRIYDFLELPNFDHDFENISQQEQYNDLAVGLPGLHDIKPRLEKTTVNPVEYLGLDLYEQYNREIFWNAWI